MIIYFVQILIWNIPIVFFKFTFIQPTSWDYFAPHHDHFSALHKGPSRSSLETHIKRETTQILEIKNIFKL